MNAELQDCSWIKCYKKRIYANFQNLCKFYVFQKINLLPQFFYGMVVIGSLSMVGDGGGFGSGVGGALGGRRVGRALPGGEGWDWESDL